MCILHQYNDEVKLKLVRYVSDSDELWFPVLDKHNMLQMT